MSVTEQRAGIVRYPPEQFGAIREPAPAGEVRLSVAASAFASAATVMQEAGARFVSMFAADTPERSLVAAFALRGELVLVRAPAGGDRRASVSPVADGDTRARAPGEEIAFPGEATAFESIGAWWPAARWAERELAELHGLRFRGAEPAAPLTAPDADSLEDRQVSGLDAFSIPYGPVRSGIFEAVQFHIETGGEDVARIHTRPFFKRRGMETRFAGLAPDLGAHVAERIAGIAGCAYAAAFAQAVERALGVQPPPRAQRWRAVYCELERMACHLDVIAKQAETTALYVGQARFQILKEQVMRLRVGLTGNRFARGMIVPGGVRGEGMMDLGELLAALDSIERQLHRDRRMFLGTASMTDRLIGTGRLPRALVEEYGAVGPLARGSGLSTDARHERPYGNYVRVGPQVVSERDGDAMARVRVRFGELSESLRILRQAIDHLRRRDGQLQSALPAGGEGAACGWVEAPQGELLMWVEVADGTIGRVHVASPSLRNWALFDHAFPKDVLTDFAFIEHSFGLTPAGADR
ncbi:MAG TPA: NADH-quinone oxidoreductase subunit C [Solirubrobacteraceae bacterium]|nr:NADH-quinone oxidoreductase subunit C [Solirubrobacteraceae bacterium]